MGRKNHHILPFFVFQIIFFLVFNLSVFKGIAQIKLDPDLFTRSSDFFTKSEQENLKQLRRQWLSLGERYVIFSNNNNDFTNILFEGLEDSIYKAIAPDYDSRGEFDASKLDWVKNKNFISFGIPGNNWSGQSLNSELVYAKTTASFFIYDKYGKLLFSFPTKNTSINGEKYRFTANFGLIYPPENIGCFVLTRYKHKKATIDFRIYNLRGEALCSWKRKKTELLTDRHLFINDTLGGFHHHFDIDPDLDVDPYFGAYVYEDTTHCIQIISFDGDTLFSKKQSQLKDISGWGVYEVISLDKKVTTSTLINFMGKQIQTQNIPHKYSTKNYYMYIKRAQ